MAKRARDFGSKIVLSWWFPVASKQHVLMVCRASFEELVLDETGGLKWSRLENLIQESSRSVGYDPSQLWLLAGVAVSPSLPAQLVVNL